MPPLRSVHRALLLGALLLGPVVACSDGSGGGSADRKGGSGGGSSGSSEGGGSEGSDTGRPAGKGVVAETATPFAAPKPAVAPAGPGAPAVGTCLAETAFTSNSQRLGLGPEVPCDGPHAAQVIAVVGLPPEKVDTFIDGGGPMTGGQLSSYGMAVVQVATESRFACQDTFDALSASALGLGPDLDGDRRVWALTEEVRIPTALEWDGGARWAACVAEVEAAEVPITGVADVTAVGADDPMPVGLQVCGNVTGRRVPCDGEIVQIQEYLQVAIEVPADEAEGGLATSEEKARATERCQAALAAYAPDLAEGGAVQAYATQEIAQEQVEPGKARGVGQPVATCSVAPTAAKGLGLPTLVP